MEKQGAKKFDKKKLKIVIIAVAVIVVAAILTSTFSDLYKKANFEEVVQGFEEKTENTLRIMSFNIRCLNVGEETWEDRIDIVTQTMLESEADSIGIQEGTPEWMATLSDTLKDKYAYVGVGRDDGENEGEYSAVFYLKDKYTVVDSGTFWLSKTPDEPSKGWDAACKRVCTWAVLQNIETGEKYVHLNSHFDHIGVIARKNSVNMILDKAKEFSDLPVVFTADMNVKEGSSNYKQFVNSEVLRDTKYASSDSMDYLTFHDTTPYKNAGRVIDYVMVNDNFDALSYKVVTEGVDGRYVSDHYPVYADITLK